MISSSASMSSATTSSTSAHMPSSPSSSASLHGQPASSSNLISLSTTVQQFDAIRKWLVKHHKKFCDSDPPSNKNLSQFLQQFIQFQEENLGKNAAKPIPQITRLPFEILLDFAPDGALCHLFAVIYKYKHQQKIPKLDLQLFGKKNQILDLCSEIETCLIENDRLVLPKCYIKQDLFVGPQLQALHTKLVEILRKHKSQLVSSVQDADHVIYPPSPDEAGNDGAEYVRVVKKRGKDHVLIHRLFRPDSHDQWLTNVDIDDDAAGLNDSSSSSNGGSDCWEVTANWLLDTDAYNEWMNQEDYEVDVDQTNATNVVRLKKAPKTRKTLEDIIKKPPPTKASQAQSKRSPSPTPPANKKARKRKHEDGPAAAKDKDEHVGVDLTKDMKSPLVQPSVTPVPVPKSVNVKKEQTEYVPYRNGTLIDLDEEQNQNSNEENKDPSLPHLNGHLVNGNSSSSSSSNLPFSNNTNAHNNAAGVNGISATTTNTASSLEQTEACEQTHHIIVPSYSAWFDYTSLHEIEKRALPEFFNQKNKSKTPEIYLGYRNFMIDTYRLNPGEYLSATACRRNLPGDVCAIIRVHAFLEQWGLINYQVDYEARAAPLGPPCTSHFTVLADTPSGLAPITGPRPTTGSQAGKQMIDFKPSAKAVKPGVPGDDKEAASSAIAADAPTVPSVEKLNIENFGLVKKPSITPLGVNGLANPSMMRNHEWSDQELLLLLEGLEMYKDDWNKVCEHVGTRNQDECILKFLQLPIEDPYLDPSSCQHSAAPLGPLAYQPIPFSQSGNPIMSTVAFLASVVDPRVASAAAKAAIAEFSKMKDEVPPQTMDAHLASVVQAAKEGKKIDANYNIEQTGIAIVKEPAVATATPTSEAVKADETKKPTESTEKSDSDAKKEGEPNKKTEEMEVDQPAEASAETADSKEKEKEAPTETEKKEEPVSNEKKETTTVATTNAGSVVKAAETTEVRDTNGNDKQATLTTSATLTLTTTTTTTTTVSATSSITASGASSAPTPPTISEAELKSAAASALAAAAVKARQLATNEEKKIKSAVSLLVETQLKKLEIKLRHFEELEAIMDRERENLELQRQQLLKERQQFQMDQFKAAEQRQKQLAAQNLLADGKLVIPSLTIQQPVPVVTQQTLIQPAPSHTPQPQVVQQQQPQIGSAPQVPTPPAAVGSSAQPSQSQTPQPTSTAPATTSAEVATTAQSGAFPTSDDASKQQTPAELPIGTMTTPAPMTAVTAATAQMNATQVVINKQLNPHQVPSPAQSPSLQQQPGMMNHQAIYPQQAPGMYPLQQQQAPMMIAQQPMPISQANGVLPSTTPPASNPLVQAHQPVLVPNGSGDDNSVTTNGVVKAVALPVAAENATPPVAAAATTTAMEMS